MPKGRLNRVISPQWLFGLVIFRVSVKAFGIGVLLALLVGNPANATESTVKPTQSIKSKLNAIVSFVDSYHRNLPEIKLMDGKITYDMINNGSFEDPADTSWEKRSFTDGVINLADSSDKFEGNFSCYLSPNPNISIMGLGIKQSFRTPKTAEELNIRDNLTWACKSDSNKFFEVYVALAGGNSGIDDYGLAFLWGASFPEDDKHKVEYMNLTIPMTWKEDFLNLGYWWEFNGLNKNLLIDRIIIDAFTKNNQTEYVRFDKVQLFGPLYDNIRADSANVKEGQQINQIPFKPKLYVSNTGMDTQENIQVQLQVLSNGSTVYIDTKTLDSLVTLEQREVEFKDFTLGNGDYTFQFGVNPLDEIPEDNNIDVNINVTGIAERSAPKVLGFRVQPLLTRGQVFYESAWPVVVYNADGREILRTDKGKGNLVLPANGVYFLKSGDFIRKVIRIK